jgi:hypothetical protein
MKWYKEDAYDPDTGEGIIGFTKEERRLLKPGDEILLNDAVTGLWAPATIISSRNGEIKADWIETWSANVDVNPADFIARTAILPPGFLIGTTFLPEGGYALDKPPFKFNLKSYSDQLWDREKDNPDRTEKMEPGLGQLIFLVRMIELLRYEFLGMAIPYPPLKHRAVNDVLPFLAKSALHPHDASDASTGHGMWVKYCEWNIRDLKGLIGIVKRCGLDKFGPLVEVVEFKTVRWIGSEEALAATLAYRVLTPPPLILLPEPEKNVLDNAPVLLPNPPNYTALNGRPLILPEPEPKSELHMTPIELTPELKQIIDQSVGQAVERMKETIDQAVERAFERHSSPPASPPPDPAPEDPLKDRLKEEFSPEKPFFPPQIDRTEELIDAMKKYFDEHSDFIRSVFQVRDIFKDEWEPELENLRKYRLDSNKHPRDFIGVIRKILTVLAQEGYIQVAQFTYPGNRNGKEKVNDWRYAKISTAVNCKVKEEDLQPA